MMKFSASDLLSAGGLLTCCVAAVQVSQLLTGQAAPLLTNYAVTAVTLSAGIGCVALGWQRRRSAPSTPAQDDRALTAALDLLFDHFQGDEFAREAVRVVARAATERRYRTEAKFSRGETANLRSASQGDVR